MKTNNDTGTLTLADRVAHLTRENEELRTAAAIQAQAQPARLLTVHIWATETGISCTYPEGTNAGDVARLVWAYIRRASARGDKPSGAIRGPL